MKIFELAEKLKAIYDQHGDIEVFFSGPNEDQDPYSVVDASVKKVKKGDYPKDFNMPAGFKFVDLTN